MSEKKKKSSDKEIEKPIVARTAADLQRLKLLKLMKNPDKPILLPDRPKSKNTPTVPEFVRNVMGSSAGAGSGEFHVYRHLRRKEYSRQKFIQEKGKKELLDDEYHKKLEENKEAADKATAKRRAKRLKKKQKQKQKKKLKSSNPEGSQRDCSDTSEEEGDDSDDEKGKEEGKIKKTSEDVDDSSRVEKKSENDDLKSKSNDDND